MPSPEHRTVTRRAIGGGTLAEVVNFPDLTAEAQRLARLSRETLTASIEASALLKQQIGEEAYDLAIRYMEGPHDTHRDLWADFVIAELCRHMPGMAPAIWTVWHHVLEGTAEAGTCCVDEVDGRF